MSGLYPKGLEALLAAYMNGTIEASVGLSVCGVTSGYTYDSSHETVEDLGDNICMEQMEIDNVTITNGVVDGDNVRFIRPASGSETDALVVFFTFDGGTQLIAYINSGESGSIPLLLVGTDVVIKWNAQGIFKI